MNVLYHTIWLIAMTLIAGMSLSSCARDDAAGSDESDNIRIRTMAVNGSRVAKVGEKADDRFVVMFWRDNDLNSLKSATADFPVPYLSQEAPQSIEFYSQTVYDTGYPYPYPETTLLYATGYAPAPVLTTEDNFRTLTVHENNPDKGRHDFLGCDLWPEVYKGSQSDPFAKDKNKLYFRHLAAKLKFYADRDEASMENKQFVRNVRITSLEMSIDGGNNWFAVHTPRQFKWSEMKDEDFTSSYQQTIAAVKEVSGNEGVTTRPQYGYHIYASVPFSCDEGFVFHRNAHDRVPISGMYVDSCYVCNPIVDGQPQYEQSLPIRFRMNISAEFSFHPDFPLGDGSNGSTTDDLTFTRTWEGVQTVIYPLGNDGKPITTGEGVKEFTPGNEYRVYVHFHRTGVNLAAVEMPWNPGGVHYITISGGDRQPAAGDEPGNNNESKN